MFLAIVNWRLIALEGGLVNPLQALLLINRNTVFGHVEPADGELCLSIAAIGRQLVPESTFLQILLHTVTVPIDRTAVLLALNVSLESGLAVSKEGFMVILFRTVAKVILLTIAICFVPFLGHSQFIVFPSRLPRGVHIPSWHQASSVAHHPKTNPASPLPVQSPHGSSLRQNPLTCTSTHCLMKCG